MNISNKRRNLSISAALVSLVCGFGGIAHSPPEVAIQSCTQDSDCPGDARCSKAGCGRTSMWCHTDADCKYSEVCDTSQPGLQSAGKCVPRGGHY